jgi:hypothetical protein
MMGPRINQTTMEVTQIVKAQNDPRAWALLVANRSKNLSIIYVWMMPNAQRTINKRRMRRKGLHDTYGP